jgi:hypothetical protein
MNRASQAYVVFAGLAVIAAAASRPVRRRASNPLDQRSDAATEQERSPAHVGLEGFSWPEDLGLRDPGDLQKALESLGYEVPMDDGPLSDAFRSAVKAFQLDWNVVVRQDGPGEPLPLSGLVDLGTMAAIVDAVKSQRNQGREWFALVSDSLERSKPEVG